MLDFETREMVPPFLILHTTVLRKKKKKKIDWKMQLPFTPLQIVNVFELLKLHNYIL